jgi:hypothetical protein
MTVTKWLIWSISLLLLSCGEEEMAKPSLRGIWARGGTKVDVTSMADTGFQKTALEYAKLNGILYQQGEWADFVDRAFGKTYYVKCTSGSDVTGDGTADYPFQTVKFAVDSIEDGGYGSIIVSEAANCSITANITIRAKSVRIVNLTNVLASDFNFTTYTNSGENDIYGFDLYQGANLIIWSKNINVSAPHDTGNDWKAGASCIRVYDHLSSVTLSAVNDITFSNTAATGTDLPSLVYNAKTLDVSYGTMNATVIGNMVTNNKGYIINANQLVATFNAYGSIDNNAYFIDGGVHINQTLASGTVPAAIETLVVSTPDGLTVTSTLPITTDSTTDDNISKTIAELLNAIQYVRTLNTSAPSTDLGFVSSRNGSGYITSMTIEVKGALSGYNAFIPLVYTGESEGWFMETQRGRRFVNVTTNINVNL